METWIQYVETVFLLSALWVANAQDLTDPLSCGGLLRCLCELHVIKAPLSFFHTGTEVFRPHTPLLFALPALIEMIFLASSAFLLSRRRVEKITRKEPHGEITEDGEVRAVMHELLLLALSRVTTRAGLAVISAACWRLSAVSKGRVLHAGQAARC